MGDEFLMADPGDAQALLRDLPRLSREGGEAVFREGGVKHLEAIEPGRHYVCQVEGGEAHGSGQVDAVYHDKRGWSVACTCDKGDSCEHIFAALRALLIENNHAKVQNLSAQATRVAPASAGAPGPAAGPRTADPNNLEHRLLEKTGGKLTGVQKQFVSKVRSLFMNCRFGRSPTGYDFEKLGMRLPEETGWLVLDVWPTLPQNEYDFWLHLAYYAETHGAHIPDFMQAITDFAELEKRMAEYERKAEIDRWTRLLAQREHVLAADTTPPGDLRLRIVGDKAHLEVRQPGSEAFEGLKQTAYRRLLEGAESGWTRLLAEADLLLRYFRSFHWDPVIRLDQLDDALERLLNHVLRSPALESRVVNAAGRPLERPAEPAIWEILPPQGLERDYLLRLRQAGGGPMPPILCTLAGSPTLYVTPDAVYRGPYAHRFLKPSETRIPAPAVEQPEGVEFLEEMGVGLPEGLRKRVQKVGYEVTIRAALQQPDVFLRHEQCTFEIEALAPDGMVKRYDGTAWIDSRRTKKGRTPKPDADIVVHDTKLLRQLPVLLEPLGLKPAVFKGLPGTRVTKQFPATLTALLGTLPPEVKVILEGELASLTGCDVSGRVKLEVTETEEIDWFDMRVVLDVSDTELTPAEVKLLLNARGQYVRLQGKGWRRLKYELTEEDDSRLARLGLNARELTAEPQRLHALQLADNAAKRFLPAEQVEQVQRRAGEIRTRVAPALPSGVTAEMRPYQLEGFHFLAYLALNRFGGILADDMGLGKTLQTLAWLVWLRQQSAAMSGKAGPSLVVCPKSVMDNWHAEGERFTPGLRVRSWAPSELAGFKEGLDSADVHVLNYSQLRMLGESLVPVRWLAVILDEGQYIKNPSSQTAQVARALQAGHRLILSGTPIENRLLDLWSLMSFAMPGVLGSRAQFARLYDGKGDPFARQRLAARVRPFLLRRTKAQVAKDLPDRVEEDLYCEIEGEQQTLYRAELKRAQQMLLGVQTREELARQQFNFLASLLRLRQICCHPALVNEKSKEPGAKLEALLEQLEPLMDEGHKVLVFSQFVELLQLVRPQIQARKWACYYLAGETENRGELVRQFQEAEGGAVFLISLKAGGFGLNLTAASYVVLFDPWWNPAVENQAIDRTHRIGQVNKVMAYRLLIKNSIEEKIRILQRQKKAMADDVLGEERFAQGLSLQDFAFLFAD